MTTTATQLGQADGGPDGSAPDSQTPNELREQKWLAAVGQRVLGQWGGRIGLVWVVLLSVIAVFAPFLASSHPLLMTKDGVTTSPLLEHLSAADVVLLVAFFAALLLWVVGLLRPVNAAFGGGSRAWVWVGVTLGAIVVCPLVMSPPPLTVLSQYREAEAAGELERVVFTVLPFSATDRQAERPTRDKSFRPPSARHPMGTTLSGADVMSRMIHATRVALAVGVIATGLSLVIGIAVGGMMGYFSGVVDLLGMRLVEVFSAIPVLFLLIIIVATRDERNIYLMMTVIGLLSWVGYALYIRAEFLKLRQADYVQAARAVGVSVPGILFRHLLPNGVTPVLVLASFGVASAILYESTLSFLGLGLVDEPSWGGLLNEARKAGTHWGLVWFPGLAIFLTVFALNLVGDALREALDPRSVK
ncbi:MAG: ABC transporter permease [Planctomycetota bacterium]